MEKNKGGRPKKEMPFTDNELQDIINLYKEGASDTEIKALIANILGSCSNDLWARWMKEEPLFSEAIKKGHLYSRAWWERKGRKNLGTKEFNSTLWYMNMKNRFGWRDKQEVEHKGEIKQRIILDTEFLPDDKDE